MLKKSQQILKSGKKSRKMLQNVENFRKSEEFKKRIVSNNVKSRELYVEKASKKSIKILMYRLVFTIIETYQTSEILALLIHHKVFMTGAHLPSFIAIS